jgi:hypothetical protein
MNLWEMRFHVKIRAITKTETAAHSKNSIPARCDLSAEMMVRRVLKNMQRIERSGHVSASAARRTDLNGRHRLVCRDPDEIDEPFLDIGLDELDAHPIAHVKAL